MRAGGLERAAATPSGCHRAPPPSSWRCPRPASARATRCSSRRSPRCPTASAVCAIGAVPVPVDVDPTTALVDPGRGRRAAPSARERSSSCTSTGGRRALPTTDLPVVEDAAQAHGALSRAPRHSRAAAYSFYPTKNLGGIGDGGAVVTDDADLADAGAPAEGARHGGALRPRRPVAELPDVGARGGLAPSGARPARGGNDRRRAIAGHYREAAPTGVAGRSSRTRPSPRRVPQRRSPTAPGTHSAAQA